MWGEPCHGAKPMSAHPSQDGIALTWALVPVALVSQKPSIQELQPQQGLRALGPVAARVSRGNLLKMEVRWSTVPDKYPNKSAVANWPYWDYYWQFVHYCCICCYCFLESWPLHRHFPMVGDLVEGYPLALSWVQLQGLELLATKIQPELTRGSTYL